MVRRKLENLTVNTFCIATASVLVIVYLSAGVMFCLHLDQHSIWFARATDRHLFIAWTALLLWPLAYVAHICQKTWRLLNRPRREDWQ